MLESRQVSMDDAPNDRIVNKAVPMNEGIPERDDFDMLTDARCSLWKSPYKLS
jgi:hypothetical protein